MPFHKDYYNSTWSQKWKTWHPKKLDPDRIKSLLTNCVYLEDDEVIVEGIRIYGSPWMPEFGMWAFGLKDHELTEIWKRIPVGADVVVTHGPAHGQCDLNSRKEHAGCIHLLEELTNRVKPAVHVCGHIHEA